MFRIYDRFVLKRIAEGRIFFVNAEMPFEYSMDCFQTEHPFFMVWQFENGRIGIMPNAAIIPPSFISAGFAPETLLPSECEYVTLTNCPYPVMITAHPGINLEAWLKKFERCVTGFGKQALATFVKSFVDVKPLKFEKPITARAGAQPVGVEI